MDVLVLLVVLPFWGEKGRGGLQREEVSHENLHLEKPKGTFQHRPPPTVLLPEACGGTSSNLRHAELLPKTQGHQAPYYPALESHRQFKLPNSSSRTTAVMPKTELGQANPDPSNGSPKLLVAPEETGSGRDACAQLSCTSLGHERGIEAHRLPPALTFRYWRLEKILPQPS